MANLMVDTVFQETGGWAGHAQLLFSGGHFHADVFTSPKRYLKIPS